MKWFLPSYRHSPDELAVAERLYSEHLDTVLPNLTHNVRRLASELSLHDAKVTRFRLTNYCNTDMVILAQDLHQNPVGLSLSYETCFPSGANLDTIREWLVDPRTVIDRDEVDYEHGKAQHRFLLWPEGEFFLSFVDLDLDVGPADTENSVPQIADVSFGQPQRPTNLLAQFSKARLLSNRYTSEGAPAGALGNIVEIYGPSDPATSWAPCWGYELEFMDENGRTTALFGVDWSDVERNE